MNFSGIVYKNMSEEWVTRIEIIQTTASAKPIPVHVTAHKTYSSKAYSTTGRQLNSLERFFPGGSVGLSLF